MNSTMVKKALRGIFICYLLLINFLSAKTQAQGTQAHPQFANEQSFVVPIKVGDPVPNIRFANVLNTPSKELKLYDIPAKLILLDMWTTWCTSCIDGFPKMEKLQKKFGKDLQVLLVNSSSDKYNTVEKILTTLSRKKEKTGYYPGLPIPIADTILNYYFPHITVPHYVWIMDKKVIGITSQLEVQEENIQDLIDGKKVSLNMKDDQSSYEFTQDLSSRTNMIDGSKFLYKSIITGFKPGIGAANGIGGDENNNITKLFLINIDLLTMYKTAYPEAFGNLPANRLLIEVQDSTLFQYNLDKWRNNVYCYELTTSPTTVEQLLNYLRQDLFRYFNINVRTEGRKMKYYVLTKNSNFSVKRFGNSDDSVIEIEPQDLHKKLRNQPVSQLVNMLNSISIYPILDSTGLKDNINIDFPFDIYKYDIDKLKTFVANNGFLLEERFGEIDVTVISSNK
ncbi:redoxin family protein [Pseudoflavitalea sp. G-6-1-2]|uniref:redoxin family protein n=1 Tax=Pseudoflavitalea sp. G-6-1-2 TaxID=2728841 RepID=UPI00146AC163|nr:redoxin family protein [Pseudoflavitalea sp. G-6-1-2]NML23001.1 redoxin family protein [Pseudoflavitalea sp. G-6-1-2]